MRRNSRGLSMVELLVGLAIGLLIAAGGVLLFTSHLRENRSLLLEARLMQDLRTASDMVSRNLRRAGAWGGSSDGIWTQGATTLVANPYAAVSPDAAASDAVAFQFSRDASENHAVDSNEQFGFRLRTGVLEMRLGGSGWQAMTDANVLTITQFSATPRVQWISLEGSCANPCPAGSATCPPQQAVRSFALRIAGRSVSDASVLRSIESTVRLRNDPVTGACAA
jgi:type IV pilus assembly protein PilW